MFPGHGYHYDIDAKHRWSEVALHFQGPVFERLAGAEDH